MKERPDGISGDVIDDPGSPEDEMIADQVWDEIIARQSESANVTLCESGNLRPECLIEANPQGCNQYKKGCAGYKGHENRKVSLFYQSTPEDLKSQLDELSLDADMDDLADLGGGMSDSRVEIAPRQGGVGIDIQVESDEYKAHRAIHEGPDGLELHNLSLTVHDTGAGLGTKIFSQQVEEADRLGIKKIRTHASRGANENGYYTWPRLGYDADVESLDPHIGDKIREAFPDAQRISDLMSTEEGRDWWKDNGESVDLEFDMSPDSLSRQILEAYKSRKKR